MRVMQHIYVSADCASHYCMLEFPAWAVTRQNAECLLNIEWQLTILAKRHLEESHSYRAKKIEDCT
jgi:hypothetical protein